MPRGVAASQLRAAVAPRNPSRENERTLLNRSSEEGAGGDLPPLAAHRTFRRCSHISSTTTLKDWGNVFSISSNMNQPSEQLLHGVFSG